jgi:hypothetical protein
MIGYKSAEAGSQLIPPGLDLLYPNQVKWIQEHNQAGDFVAVVNDDKCHKIAVDLKAYAKQFSLPSMQLELTEENMHNVLYMTLMRSDHSPFWMKGYPAMMITDTSEYRNLNYHCPNQTVDSINRLDPDFAVAILRSTIAAAVNVLGLR